MLWSIYSSGVFLEDFLDFFPFKLDLDLHFRKGR